MLTKRIILLLFLSASSFLSSFGQQVSGDTTAVFKGEKETLTHEELETEHSPKKATILSALIPGAGQIYNKKYWKLPIVWGGIGVSLYYSQVNRNEYHKWKDQYIKRLDPDQEDDYPLASDASLENQMTTYRKWMETSYVVAGVVYILQILDANVDAQLMSFDVSDDLSLNVRPDAYINQRINRPTYGLTLTLGFK